MAVWRLCAQTEFRRQISFSQKFGNEIDEKQKNDNQCLITAESREM